MNFFIINFMARLDILSYKYLATRAKEQLLHISIVVPVGPPCCLKDLLHNGVVFQSLMEIVISFWFIGNSLFFWHIVHRPFLCPSYPWLDDQPRCEWSTLDRLRCRLPRFSVLFLSSYAFPGPPTTEQPPACTAAASSASADATATNQTTKGVIFGCFLISFTCLVPSSNLSTARVEHPTVSSLLPLSWLWNFIVYCGLAGKTNNESGRGAISVSNARRDLPSLYLIVVNLVWTVSGDIE